MAEEWQHLEDWEEWNPSKGSYALHAVAGSFAGAAEHCVMFPVDTVKTHLQAEGAGAANLRSLVETQGFNRLWRGLSTMLYACIPAHAAYFAIYEQSKVAFGADSADHTPIRAAACGAVATLAHDSVMTPMDVIKQRLQLGLHSGIRDCARSIIRTEGASALFLSFPTTLMMNIPHNAIVFAANDSIKKVINPSGEYNLGAFFVSGGVSGAIASAFTNPLDVAKTRLQTQLVLCQTCETPKVPSAVATGGSSVLPGPRNGGGGVGPSGVFAQRTYSGSSLVSGRLSTLGLHSRGGLGQTRYVSPLGTSHAYYEPPRRYTVSSTRKGPVAVESLKPCAKRYTGLVDTMQKIYQEEGWRGFTRGMKPRMLYQAPSVAIAWTTYETAKEVLAPVIG